MVVQPQSEGVFVLFHNRGGKWIAHNTSETNNSRTNGKRKINGKYYVNCLRRFNNNSKEARPYSTKKKLPFHQDNARDYLLFPNL